MNLYCSYFKRAIDIALSGCGLIVLSPVLAVVTVWLHFANKGAGAFFFQERPGRDCKVFKVIKFKTMTDECDIKGRLLPDNERLTTVGRFVRSTSIDELPQLWNVLRGDMSLIGPRPLLTWFIPLYDSRQIHRHDVVPGITGWAQVHGRNEVSYSKKFELDLWYVDHISFKTDLKVLLTTIKNVFMRKDVGVGLEDEMDDLGWEARKEWAEQQYELYYRNKSVNK